MTLPTQTQHGYLFLADISGYTSYLAGVELDHAHEILTHLLETIVKKVQAVLTISKLEGDAVFAYVPEHKLPRGETLLELIEATYVAFCDQREASHWRTTCTCAACKAIPTLDLKFFVHHGDFIIQTITTIRELVGSDVNLIHRLMKNHISEATGWKAYALFTEKALAHLEARPDNLHFQVETYEHLGDVQTHSYDLKPRYAALIAARKVFITAQEADYVCLQDFPAAPPVVWEWLNSPRTRNIWAKEAGTWRAGLRPGGRTGVGARNHCAHGHGKSEAVETILDWRPFDYLSAETNDGGTFMRETLQLEALPNGMTRMHDHIQVKMPLPAFIRRPVVRLIMKMMFKYERMMSKSARLLGEEQAELSRSVHE